MMKIQLKELKNLVGQEVTIAGHVHAIRDQNKIIFLILRDITGIVQCVALHEIETFPTVKLLTLESVVKICGLVKSASQAPGGFEVEIKSLDILSLSDANVPIPVNNKAKNDVDQPIRLDYRWLDLRTPEHSLVFKVWTELEKGFRSYWSLNNFIQIYPPSFMRSASESGSEVFEVKYFDRKAYLAQSPQFYKQMGIASGFERVCMVAPVFRAEESFTTRHLTEFTGWDFEIGYIDSHHDVMDQEEGMIISGFKAVKQAFPEIDIEIPSSPFPRITLAEVKSILKKEGVSSEEDFDMSPEEERALSEYVRRELNHDFVFIIDWPKTKRAFYHMRFVDNPELTKSADLLYRGIEITTLAQREHRPDILEKQAVEKGIHPEEIKDYLNFFKYGCPPHGGAGIGPARLIMKMLGLANVREATYLPRDVKRLTP